MFFRQKKTPSGFVLQLLQSYRNKEDEPRSRVILSLGDAPIPETDRLRIAHRVDLLLSGQKELVENDLSAEQNIWVDRILRLIQQRGVRALDEITGPISSAIPSASSSSSNQSAEVGLFPLPPAAPLAPGPGAAALELVEHSHATSAGAELLGLHAWNTLKLSQALQFLGFNDAQIRCAQASVINRLVEPVSEHALGPWLSQTSSLPDLIRESFEGKHVEGRFYRVSDLLHENSAALEAHLREQQQALFGQRPTIFLYDLTNTYFEGQAEGNPEARHGHSKEKRTDCPLISIALAFSQDGLPLGHKVFAGNQNDARSFPEILERLTTEWRDLCAPGQRALFVMDCGIGTAANCLLLRQHAHDYLASERRGARGEYAPIFAAQEDFTQIPGKTVRVKMQTTPMPPDAPLAPAAGPDSVAPSTDAAGVPANDPAAAPLVTSCDPASVSAGSASCVAPVVAPTRAPASAPASAMPPAPMPPAPALAWEETRLFCRSEARGEKEKAMLAKACARFEADLKKLAQSVTRGRVATPAKIHQRLGRLKERHSGVSRYYEITLQPATPPRPETPTRSETVPVPVPVPPTAPPPPETKVRSAAAKTTAKISRKAALPPPAHTLSWTRKDEAGMAESLCGDYCLHSNRRFEDAAGMWSLYTGLTQAEDGFRCLKTDLGLRPVHHQTSERVRAHIFISVLALHLMCYLKKSLEQAGAPARTWTTLKRLLSEHAYVTLSLKTAEATHHLRKLGEPNQEQKAIYKALKIDLAECPKTRLSVPLTKV